MVFQKAGIATAASLMNAVILTSVLSCGNSGMYASTRMLYALAKEGKAPKWLGIAICHYRFRKAYVAKFFPTGPIIALVLCIVVILGQGISYMSEGVIDWNGMIAAYIGLPLFIGLWLGYKTKVIELKNVDLDYRE